MQRTDCFENVVSVEEFLIVSLAIDDEAAAGYNQPDILENIPFLLWMVEPDPLLYILAHSPPIRKD